MKRILIILPPLLTVLAALAMLWHGPIAQFAHYNDFADEVTLFGVPNALNVFSNLGFLLLGVWGWGCLRAHAAHPPLREGWAGYRLMLLGLILVGLGSGYYHLAPGNARLVWDRLPIALVCAGLLAAVRAETRPGRVDMRATLGVLLLCAVSSVLWWQFTDSAGQGDLRPYLLLQTLPLVLIPLWQAAYDAPRADRIAFGLAMAMYVLAKAAELHDRQILAALGLISGHSLKHLLATGALALILVRLVARTHEGALRPAGTQRHPVLETI